MLTHDLIAEAAAFLEGRIVRTPVEASPALAERLGGPVWLKLESLQTTGSFKVRGALFKLARLSAEERGRGVAACSAGNHGKGVAYAARALGVAATVYVPSTVDESKRRGMIELGAEVVVTRFPGYDDTLAFAREEAVRAGRTFIPAFDDPAIMAANGGTLALECLAQCPRAARFVVPAGGCGLAAGFAFAVKGARPDAAVIAVQHEGSPALALSLERGEAVTRLPPIDTLAGGIEGGLGAPNFEVLRERIDGVALVSEAAIRAAVVFLLDRHQHLVEPTGAVGAAACLAGKIAPADVETVVVLTGRNVALATLRAIL